MLQPRQENKLLTGQEAESYQEHKKFWCQHIMKKREAWSYESIFLMPDFTFNNEKWPFINDIF